MHRLVLCVRAWLLVAMLAVAAVPGRADAAWSDVVQEGLAAALAVAGVPGRADAAWSDVVQDGLAAARAAQQTLRERTEQAIVAGGVLLYRHRHAVAGAALGCVAGSVAATTTTLGAGLATGGASLTTTAPAAALGCGLGALSGAALGQRLDNVYDVP